MGGMIVDWRTYRDPLNAVQNPGQMALQCYQVRHSTGVPLDERIWLDDPPASSYPACLAVKAAERQSPQAAELYLGRLRRAVMVQRRNIARWEVLQTLAEEAEAEEPKRFDASRFADDLNGEEVVSAFRDDLMQVRYRQIDRFPSLLIAPAKGPSALLVGYRPYEALRQALG